MPPNREAIAQARHRYGIRLVLILEASIAGLKEEDWKARLQKQCFTKRGIAKLLRRVLFKPESGITRFDIYVMSHSRQVSNEITQ